MNKPKVVLTASAVFLSAALAVAFFLPQEKTNTASSSEVYTWDCEYPEVKPEAITITCADGGQYIDDITWDTWSSSGAQGTGVYHVNDCDPNCAEGDFLSAPVTIQLSNLSTYQGKSYLRTMTFESVRGEKLPNSDQSFYQWDLMEFVEGMEKNDFLDE
jgi:hypothetical protein